MGKRELDDGVRTETERATKKKKKHHMRRNDIGRIKTKGKKMRQSAKHTILFRHNRVLHVPEPGGVDGGIEGVGPMKPFDNYVHPAYAKITWSSNESDLVIQPYDKEDRYYKTENWDKKKENKYPRLAHMLPYPLRTHSCSGSTNVICQSKLFFISGQGPWSGHHYTKSVFAFDLITQTWITDYKPIQTPRASHLAIAVGGVIYVFGNIAFAPLPMEHWGERFNVRKNEWKYLPRPPEPLYTLHQLRAYSVYYNCHSFYYTTKSQAGESRTCFVPRHQNLILFPLPDAASSICVFNCNTNEWLPDIYPKLRRHRLSFFPERSKMFWDQQVVVDGVLFWHCDGSIHGYDLIDEKCLPSLFKIPFRKLHICGDDSCYFPATYLVHPGDHNLFLFFQFACDMIHIHCFRFEIQPNKRGMPRRLRPKPYSRFSTRSINQIFLQDVLLCPSAV